MNRPQEIVLVRSTYAPFGGVERVAMSLIQGLLDKGFQVTVLTLPAQKWPLTHPNLRFVPLGIGRGHRLLQAWSFNRSVVGFIKRNDSHRVISLDKVTHCTHLHAGGGTHKSFLALKAQYSGVLSRWLQRLSLFHRYILYVEKTGFGNPMLRKVRCNSRMVKEVIQKDYAVPEDKLVLVPSGIRWQEIQEGYQNRADLGSDLCRKHGLDPDRPYLLFLGSGFPNKGLDVAIEGLSSISQEYHLVVVGKGNPHPYLRLARRLGTAERLHFLGPQPQGWRYASFCRAMVLPSQYDPFGGAAAEGHAMGIPVLVSDKTGYSDYVIHGENGVVIKTPMKSRGIQDAFKMLQMLIEQPRWSPDRLRSHANQIDDDVVLGQLMDLFLDE